MEQIPTFEQVVELLQGVLSGNNEKIQYATKVLKKYSKIKESVGILVQIIMQSTDVGLQHLSAVLLRKNILQTFQQLEEQAQNELKAVLLQKFMDGNVTNVIRKQIGYSIGQIAQVTLHQGKWNELYQVLQQQTDKTLDLQQRKGGILLLSTILDYSGEAMKEFYGGFYDFFLQSIQDPAKEIKIETAKCLVVLFDNIGYMSKDQITQYKGIINPLLNFLDELVKQEDEDNVHLIFDGFSYLAESKLSILDDHFKVIIEYCCSNAILHNANLPFIIKETVCDLIYTIAEKHRAVFNKNIDLMKKVVESCCLIVSQPYTQEQLEEANGENLQDCVLWLVLMLAVHLNKKKLYGILLQAVTSLVNSQDPNQQNTGFLILAQMSEGLQDQLIRNLSNPIMNEFIPIGLNSQHPEVKGACIKALGFFAEWLGGSIVEYHNIILPEILKSFANLTIKVQEKAMITLDVFCDSMEEDQIVPYLPELVPQMIQVPYMQNTSVIMKRASLSCIASCISTAGKQFRSYIPQVYSQLHEIINAKESPETDVIKSEAINAVAKIAGHFSRDDNEVHQQVIVPVMEKIYDLLCNYGNYEINEGCFSYFYCLAEAQGNEFAPIFDKVIEITLKSAASNEGIEYQREGKEGGEFSLDSDSEDEEAGATGAKVKQGFLDEKGAAIHALGEFAVAVPLKFQNYFEKALDVLEQVYDHFHDNIRLQAIICYRDLVLGMVKCSNQGVLPKFEKGLPVLKKFEGPVEEKICIEIWQKFIHSIRNEKEKEIVANNIECQTSLIKKLGPAYFTSNIEDLYDIVQDLLEKRTICQNGDEEDEEDEEDDETDGLVFEAITDLIPAIAGSLQQGFELGYKKLFPSMMAYMNVKQDINIRVQIVGSFCQVFKKCHKSIIQLSLEYLLAPLLNGVTENDDELSRNIAYALGLIVQRGREYLKNEDIQNIMIALKHVYDNTQDDACKDNAAAGLCRVILGAPDLVPITNAMDTIMSIAPFKGDDEEEKVLLQTIIFLADSQGEYLQKNIDKIIALFIDGLANAKKYKIKEKYQVEFISFVKKLATSYQEKVEQTVMKLGEEDKNRVINLLK